MQPHSCHSLAFLYRTNAHARTARAAALALFFCLATLATSLAASASVSDPPALRGKTGVPAPQKGYLPAVPVTPVSGRDSLSTVSIESLPQTIGIEHTDRVRRFSRLAALAGVQAPVLDEMQLPAGLIPGFDYPIPVVRVRYNEGVFFNFNEDEVVPAGEAIIRLIAENMRNDLPDVHLTVLGHTDAIGSDEYNDELSRRRAENVIQRLFRQGVRLSQMSSVAVGKRQPAAPNSTAEGRARNRRVEFMISASEAANLALIGSRRVIKEWLATDPTRAQPHAQSNAELVVMHPKVVEQAPGQGDSIRMAQVSTVKGRVPQSQAEVRKVAPPPDIRTMPLKEFQLAKLKEEFDL